MSKGVDLIAAERKRQVEVEGWNPRHDLREHCSGELAQAAACYATGRSEWWPWCDEDYKPKDRLSDLVRAGALIAAEIDRWLAAEQSKE